MVSLENYITEKLLESFSIGSIIGKNKPKSKQQLRKLIEQELEQQGPNADLNHIDVSKITDMEKLFYKLDIRNIKIDQWDVSNVKNMRNMFWNCSNFNADLSKWDVRNVVNMERMFYGCEKFKPGLFGWQRFGLSDDDRHKYNRFDGLDDDDNDISEYDSLFR